MRKLLLTTGLLLTTVPSFAKTITHTRLAHAHATSHASLKHTSASKSKKSSTHAATVAAHHEVTPGMPAERATEIQTALIKQGYLSGEPTGAWDTSTISAMAKLQGDNGWQTKITPDSRALIKLGLGPQDTPAQQ